MTFALSIESVYQVDNESASLPLNSSGDKFASWVQVPEDITVSHIGFGCSNVFGTPLPHKYSIQSILSSGVPDGIDRASGFITPASGDANLFHWIALDSPLSLSKAEEVALVLLVSSGIPDASNCINVLTGYNAAAFPRAMFAADGGAWTVSPNVALNPIYGLKNSDESIVLGYPRSLNQTLVSHYVTTNGHRQALKFKMPNYFGNGFRLAGIVFYADVDDTLVPVQNNMKMGLWDEFGNVLNSRTMSISGQGTTGNISNEYELYFDNSDYVLVPDRFYYVGLERNGNDFTIDRILTTEANDMRAYGVGTNFYYSSWNGTVWTDDQARRPLINLIFDDWLVNAPAQVSSIATSEQFGTPTVAYEILFLAEDFDEESEFGIPTFDEGAQTLDAIISIDGVLEIKCVVAHNHQATCIITNVCETSLLTLGNVHIVSCAINGVCEVSASHGAIHLAACSIDNRAEVSVFSFANTLIAMSAIDNRSEISVLMGISDTFDVISIDGSLEILVRMTLNPNAVYYNMPFDVYITTAIINNGCE